MDPSDKQYPIGTKIEREFKKNGIIRSAEVVAFNLDTKLYTLEWEEENTDTEKGNDTVHDAP